MARAYQSDVTTTAAILVQDTINRRCDNPLSVLIQATATAIYLGGSYVDATHGIAVQTTLYPSGIAFALHSNEKLYAVSSSGTQTVTILELNN